MARQQQRNVEITKTGRFVLWPKQLLPLMMHVNDSVDGILDDPNIDIDRIHCILESLIQLEDEVKKIFGVTMLEK